jgi:hypothetical protein
MEEEGGPANSVQAAKKLPATDEAAVIAAVAEEANDYYLEGCQERKPITAVDVYMLLPITAVAAAPGYVALDPVVMPAGERRTSPYLVGYSTR